MAEACGPSPNELRSQGSLRFSVMHELNINSEREAKRSALAEALWRTPYAQLMRYGISSYREITNLDRIGLPVWISHRPISHTISVNAGKSEDWLQGFAGCIVEAIEFWAAE